ncbi:Prefoldin, subunit 4 [Sanghuangporus baumii]|uniref:Prefoldin, subunit 4 n=1 Tax=Sanghuangporus baumii TaxID=108892 RepID=A0A9Q5HYX9_SANBA|nr:Prefoldin, subunit 4 [Sanghuangporus baumii]
MQVHCRRSDKFEFKTRRVDRSADPRSTLGHNLKSPNLRLAFIEVLYKQRNDANEQLKQEEEKEDVEVTWDDQQRICTFSKLNTRLRGYEERLKVLKEEKEALDDLAMELELADEEQPILYVSHFIGETFVHLPLPRALKRVENDNTALNEDISKLGDQAEECEKEMKKLKVTLYSKFGSAINLDE